MGFDVDYDELWIVTSQNRVQSNCDVMAFTNSIFHKNKISELSNY